MPEEFAASVWVIIGGIAELFGLVFWMFCWRRKRLIEDIPTSRAAGVALGLTEVTGRAESDGMVISPYGCFECVWWKAEIWKRAAVNDDWKKVETTYGGGAFFNLVDPTGSVRVWPRNAHMALEKAFSGPRLRSASADDFSWRLSSLGDERVDEYVIPAGADLYVLGTAILRDDAVEAEITADPRGEDPFIISVGSQRDALFGERLGALVGLVISAIAAVVVAVAWSDGDRLARAEITWSQVNWRPPALALAGLGLVMAVATLVFLHNALVGLRTRAQRAWSLIDVELQRRHDLVPQLVGVVLGHRDHEFAVQTRVAKLRASMTQQLPPKPSDSAVRSAGASMHQESSAIRELLALVEAYPDLGAHASFLELQHELERTETRLALAREFYNDSAANLRTRATTFPGVLLAWTLGMSLRAEFTHGETDQHGIEMPELQQR